MARILKSKIKLKRGIFRTPQSVLPVERVIIENTDDLKNFAKAFSLSVPSWMIDVFEDDLKEGLTVIVKEPQFGSIPSYCYETAQDEPEHPSNFKRVETFYR
jgi:hypothetical protein